MVAVQGTVEMQSAHPQVHQLCTEYPLCAEHLLGSVTALTQARLVIGEHCARHLDVCACFPVCAAAGTKHFFTF